MNTFLQLPADRRRRFCEEAQAVLGLPAESIEKDFWVCWTLRELFALPGIGSQLTFKGGTSLSKCWKLIERFSEDIDLVVDRETLGFGGDKAPQQSGITGKERERRLVALKTASQYYIRETLKPALEGVLQLSLTAALPWSMEEASASDGGIALLFVYPAAFPPRPGFIQKVKIEPGARSDIEPTETPVISTYLEQALPKAVPTSPFAVRTVAPQRTFWEKAMLLHEETYRDSAGGLKSGLSRHYYDLHSLIKAGVAAKAAADLNLFERIAAHRAVFFRKKKEAQASLQPGSLRLLPPANTLAAWKQDYEKMRDFYFFGEVPKFDEIVRVVGEFEQQFNQQAKA